MTAPAPERQGLGPVGGCPHVAYDLEMDGDTILCGATWTSHANGAVESSLWTSKHPRTGAYVALEMAQIVELLQYLAHMSALGYVIVTWGGSASDWRVLYAAVPPTIKPMAVLLALHHVDIPMISCASSGMIMGLSAATAGMEIPTGHANNKIFSGVVPVFWKSGELAMQLSVIQHVVADAMHTSEIYRALWAQAQSINPVLTWITQRQQRRSVRLRRSRSFHGAPCLPTLQECLSWPRPTTAFAIPRHLQRDVLVEWLYEASTPAPLPAHTHSS